MTRKNTFPPLTCFVFLISFIFFYFAAPSLFSFPDVFWHLAAGDYIREIGAIPHTDPWSYTTNNTQWYNLSWSYDVIISVVKTLFGKDGLYYFDITLAALVISLVYINCATRKVSVESIFIVCALIAITIYVRVGLKPHMVSYLFALIFYLQCFNAQKTPKSLNYLPFLMILWVNMHGGFLQDFQY